MAGDVLKDQTNDVLDLWYGYVGGNAHLDHYFTKNGQPLMNCKSHPQKNTRLKNAASPPSKQFF